MSYETAMAQNNEALFQEHQIREEKNKWISEVFESKVNEQKVIVTGRYDKRNEIFEVEKVEWKDQDVTPLMEQWQIDQFEEEGRKRF